jgi:hypothetical protein
LTQVTVKARKRAASVCGLHIVLRGLTFVSSLHRWDDMEDRIVPYRVEHENGRTGTRVLWEDDE